MANEYSQHLEEEIEDLEGENTLLSLEVERLQEKFDLLEEKLRGEITDDLRRKHLKDLKDFGYALGIDHIGGIIPAASDNQDKIGLEIEAYRAAVDMKIADMKRQLESTYKAAKPNDVVRFMIRSPEPTYRDMRDMTYGRKAYDHRDYYSPYEEQHQSYQMTINDLQKEHLQAIKALNYFIKRYTRDARDYSGKYDLRETESRIRSDIAKQYGIHLLEHIKED